MITPSHARSFLYATLRVNMFLHLCYKTHTTNMDLRALGFVWTQNILVFVSLSYTIGESNKFHALSSRSLLHLDSYVDAWHQMALKNTGYLKMTQRTTSPMALFVIQRNSHLSIPGPMHLVYSASTKKITFCFVCKFSIFLVGYGEQIFLSPLVSALLLAPLHRITGHGKSQR